MQHRDNDHNSCHLPDLMRDIHRLATLSEAGTDLVIEWSQGSYRCRSAIPDQAKSKGVIQDMLSRLKEWVAGKSKGDRLPHLEVQEWRDVGSPAMESTELDEISPVRSAPYEKIKIHSVTTERPKILVVVDQPYFPDCVMDYTVHLAERLRYDILAMHVGNLGEQPSGASRQAPAHHQYTKHALEAADALKHRASAKGIHCEHLVKFGDLAQVVAELHHQVKRIEFVITDSEANKEEIFDEVTIPVFSVTPTYWWSEQGGKTMAKEMAAKKSKPVGKTIMFGIATVALYAAVFTNADTLMKYFTRGGWYAALPIATVFVFSYVHGTFAGSLWSALGIEARKKDALQPTEEKRVQPKKQPRKKTRVYAYVNPWHRI